MPCPRRQEDRYNGPPAWQRVRQFLCYVILYTCFSAPHPLENASLTPDSSNRISTRHTSYELADSFLFLIREPASKRNQTTHERSGASLAERQWRGRKEFRRSQLLRKLLEIDVKLFETTWSLSQKSFVLYSQYLQQIRSLI